jgi:hypothetical protein
MDRTYWEMSNTWKMLFREQQKWSYGILEHECEHNNITDFKVTESEEVDCYKLA